MVITIRLFIWNIAPLKFLHPVQAPPLSLLPPPQKKATDPVLYFKVPEKTSMQPVEILQYCRPIINMT